MIRPILFLAFFFLLISSCKKEDDNSESITSISNQDSKPNILLIIADDMGLDASPGYTVGTSKPNMPNLQSLINSGIKFNNVWAYPTCTPTRSSIITGKYGYRTNVLNVGDELSTTETSLQNFIGTSYSNAVIGKWHLSTDANHPTHMGVEYYAGLLTGAVQSYTNWNFTENGQTTNNTEYTTSKFTDLAINWIDQQDKPWFLWLAYNAPHTPFHLPPDSLHYQGVLPNDDASITANPSPYFNAMLEAMDTEMGRLINSMSQAEKDNTVIIFIGDNGTTREVAQEYNSNRVKGTIYQGGINVPLVISGNGISRLNEEENALITSTDLFATIAELSGKSVSSINDSKSFKSLFTTSSEIRDYAYSEIGLTGGGTNYTIRNNSHKYVVLDDGTKSLFNLIQNPFETPDLLRANNLPLSSGDSLIHEELKAELLLIRN